MNALKYETPIRGQALNGQEFIETPINITGTTYAFVRGSPDTITSSANNFITAGFKNGMVIGVSGSSEGAPNNSGHYVLKVEAGTLTLGTTNSVIADAAGDTWTIVAYTGGTLKDSIYSNMRAVMLRRFNIEMTGNAEVDIGASTAIATDYSDPTFYRKMGNVFETTDTVYKPTIYALNTPYEVFSRFKLTETTSGVQYHEGNDTNTGESIADGVDYVLKPLLETTDASVTKNYGYVSPNGQTDLTQLIIDTSSAETGTGTIRDSANKWIEFVPNLTGCYLVSNDGVRIEDSNIKTGVNRWVTSMDDRMPNKIHYIVSHTIRTDSYSSEQNGQFNKHILLIDNCDASDELGSHYRIMRSAHVCLWPKSPTEIDLYKSTTKYTKKPNMDTMYDDIGDISYWEDGHLKGEKSAGSYNEGIQSMYVVVNPDHTSTNNRFLVPRTIAGNHVSELFGNNKPFSDGSYNMLLNDGIEKNRRTIVITTGTKTISSTDYDYTSISYGENLPRKMSGIVSLGEIFTITSSQVVNLKDVTSASIGSSIKVGQDSEDIINDILETNKISYTKSDKEKLYITTPNLQGSDLYTAVDYLANLKNKEINILRNNIEIIAKSNDFKYSGLEINEKDSNINVIEIEQNDSAFGFYNEVILYGNGFKSVRRNAKSIREVGKVTYEEFDDTLYSQTEVEERAQSLLTLFTVNTKRVTVKCSDTNLELIKAGDIIVIDFPSEHIPRSYYMVLEIRYNTMGQLELECGGYTKTLDNHLASIILSQKKISSYLRKSKFKSLEVDDIYYDSMRLKPIKLSMTRQVTQGNTAAGLNTQASVDTTQAIGNLTNEDVLWEEYG